MDDESSLGCMDDPCSDDEVLDCLDDYASDASVVPIHPSDDGDCDSDNEMQMGGIFGDEEVYVRPNQTRPSCDGLGVPNPEPWIRFAQSNAQEELDREQRTEVDEFEVTKISFV